MLKHLLLKIQPEKISKLDRLRGRRIVVFHARAGFKEYSVPYLKRGQLDAVQNPNDKILKILE